MKKNLSLILKSNFAVVLLFLVFVFAGAFCAENANAQTGDIITGVDVSGQNVIVVGDTIKITPVIGSATNGVTYKYVWNYNGSWKTGNWGVIKDFSSARYAHLKVAKAGKYELYIDAKRGNVITTKKVVVDVKNVLSGVNVSTKTVIVGDTVTISPKLLDERSDVDYKYVWNYGGSWKAGNWGVIRDFSKNKSAGIKVNKTGNYEFYIDAKRGGVTTTQKIVVNVKNVLSGVNTSGTVFAGDTVTVSPKLLDERSDVDYKYVWNYGGSWKTGNWGVIKDFSRNRSAGIKVSRVGNYEFYIDAKRSGVISTQKAVVNVKSVLSGVNVSSKKVYVGDTVTISPKLLADRADATYKYVWSYNDSWKSGDWGVVKDFSTTKSVVFKTKKFGKYTFYIDVKRGGVTSTQSVTIDAVPIISGVNVSSKSVVPGGTVTISPKLSENREGLKFKYVWSYEDSWKEGNWGVIKDFSDTNSVTFKIPKAGVYNFYVDVDNNGVCSTAYTFATTSNMQAKSLANLPEDEIIDIIGPIMREDQKNSGVLASVSMAQFILESGYGKSELAQNANNCFGMKDSISGNTWSGSTWDGKSVYLKQTLEEYTPGVYTTVTASFRKYSCIESSVADHSAYLVGAKQGNSLRYPGLKGCKDYKKAAQIIKSGGYATDADYVQKLCSIIERWNLTKYDIK